MTLRPLGATTARYSNDWYILPCDVPTGTFAAIQRLAVTDVFGARRWITPAGAGAEHDWQQWSMYVHGDAPGLLLPPGTPKVADGPALEEVQLARDENANMVWGIEQTVRMPTGDPRPGAEAAAETLAFRRRLRPPTRLDDSRAALAYRVMSLVPEHWIPFIPVHVPGDNRSVQLQRAPLTGTRLTAAYNRTRTRTGQVIVWLTVRRDTGRGGRSSGLAFDLLTDTTPQ
ncbi:hypothetical protein ACIBO2_56915 [Nonomuraea sp. NPDC050022]|uniref:hypothetical protein n=1 Tax=Nonomuraea sp. NPDC050022 TaxID=3364358 RepID=UPI0037AE60E0